MLFVLLLLSTVTIAFAEPKSVDIGVYGSWQSKLFDGETWLQQQRIHLRSDIEWDGIGVHVDLMDARVWGSELSYKTNKDTLANLYAGYVKIPLGTIGGIEHTLQMGRQEIILNDQRYFAPGAWALGGRSFDALVVKGIWNDGSWQIAALQLNNGGTYTRSETDCTENCDVTSHGDHIVILNAIQRFDNLNIKPYFIHQRNNPSEINLDAHRRIYSPGVLISGAIESGFYRMEGTYQWGQHSSTEDHLAWMGAGELGFQKDRFKVSLYGEHNSGDNNTNDGVNNNLETFIGRYHGLRGWSDQVGGINLRDYSVRFQLPLNPKWVSKIEAHQFQMDQVTGNLYAFNSGLIGAASQNNTDRNLGKELDLLFVHKPFDGIAMKWGHSIFMPEGAKQDFVGSEPIHFSYLWMTVQK